MHGYAGVIVFRDESVLLVQVSDFFVHDPVWTLPSGAIEDGETPSVGASRELAEESGCHIAAPNLELVATTDVEHHGEKLSRSWNFTAMASDSQLEFADPDEEVLAAEWFERPKAIEALSLHRYDPIREPVVRFLNSGERRLHWTFELTDPDGAVPVFRWEPPTTS